MPLPNVLSDYQWGQTNGSQPKQAATAANFYGQRPPLGPAVDATTADQSSTQMIDSTQMVKESQNTDLMFQSSQ